MWRRILLILCMLFMSPNMVHASLQVSEVYANPPGDETAGEWIELWNSGESDVSTLGYDLSDVAGVVKHYSLPEKIVHSGETLLIPRTESAISLNNDGEQVVLKRPDGSATSSPWFISIEGKSISYKNTEWVESVPTPGFIPPEWLLVQSVIPSPSPSFSPTPFSQTIIVSPTPSPSPSTMPSSFFSTVTVTPTPIPTSAESKPSVALELSEVAACGSPKEWVELWNPSDQVVILDSWALKDSSGVSHSLEGFSISPLSFIVLEWKNGWLSNSGDQLSLFWKDQIVDDVMLPACGKGQSYIQTQGDWLASKHPTPGYPNQVDELVSSSLASFFSATFSGTTRSVASQGGLIKSLKSIQLDSKNNKIKSKHFEILSDKRATNSSASTGGGNVIEIHSQIQNDHVENAYPGDQLLWLQCGSALLCLVGGILLSWEKRQMIWRWIISSKQLVNPWPSL